MAVGFSNTNKPINPRGNDASPKAFNRAKLYSGKALDFDGVNDTLTTTYTSGFTGTQEFTYCTYVNADNIALNQHFLYAAETTGWGLQSLQIRSNGVIRFFAGTGTESTSYVTSETIEANKWYFVVGVHTPTENKIYLNGVLNATAAAANLTTAPTAINIQSAFNGETANAKIFNTALTAAQVADLYNNPEKVVPTGVDNTALKLWLPMQEGAGTTAYDGSGNNLGSEEVTNGDFATDSDWTKESGWTISGGKATFDGSAATNALYQNIGGVSGTKYLLSFEVTDYVSGSVKAYLSNGDVSASTPSINANGKYVFDITATGVLCLFRNETSFNGSIDNVSVKELTSYGTISGATWTHGIGAPVAQTSVIDWNKWTLDGSNDILIPQGLTSGRDLLGNLFENVRKQGALNLDGNSWAEVHDNASVDLTDAITLEAWVNIKSGETIKGILGRWSSSQGYMIYLATDSDIRFYINNAYSFYSSMTTGWRHIVATYDKSNRKLYVDGVLRDTDAMTAAIATSSNPVEIGRYAGNTSYEYDGDIAQPRIYNRALTAAEVLQNYNSGKNTYK